MLFSAANDLWTYWRTGNGHSLFGFSACRVLDADEAIFGGDERADICFEGNGGSNVRRTGTWVNAVEAKGLLDI